MIKPDKGAVYGSIEGMIQHSELVMTNRGWEAPVAEVYAANETANGEPGFFVVGDGSPRLRRARCGPPNFINYQVFAKLIEGHLLADVVAVARNIARFFSHESCGQCTPCREGSGWIYKILGRIESDEGTTRDRDRLLEFAGSMGDVPGTTICGLADGTNWAIRTILNKFWDEFEHRVRKDRYVSLAIAGR